MALYNIDNNIPEEISPFMTHVDKKSAAHTFECSGTFFLRAVGEGGGSEWW